jgi:hypothetical protein
MSVRMSAILQLEASHLEAWPTRATQLEASKPKRDSESHALDKLESKFNLKPTQTRVCLRPNRKTNNMNGQQLHEWIMSKGMPEDFEGHVNVLLDTWTGQVLSIVAHPEAGHKSITILVASCEMEASQGNLIAGGAPTTHGDVLDSWLDVCDKAIPGATTVSTAYISSLFDVIGFSSSRFFESEAAEQMTNDARFAHLSARLNYAATRKFVNRMVASCMDLDGDDRQKALDATKMSDMYLETVEKILHEVDGQ